MEEQSNRKIEIDGQEYTRYECSQLQRKLETQLQYAREEKAVYQAAGLDDLTRNATEKIRLLGNKYHEVSRKAELPTRAERLRVYGKVQKQKMVNNPAFLPIKGKENLPSDFVSRMEKEMSMIPERHRAWIAAEVKEFEFHENRNSGFDKTTGILHLKKDFIPGELAHEFGHAIEKHLRIYHNPEFVKVAQGVLGDKMATDIILDPETFSKPIFRIESEKLVSLSQGRLYDEIDIFDENGGINLFSFAEYFAEGYNYYIVAPEILKTKDYRLFEFISKLGGDTK